MTRSRAILGSMGVRTVVLTIAAIVLILVGLPFVLLAAGG